MDLHRASRRSQSLGPRFCYLWLVSVLANTRILGPNYRGEVLWLWVWRRGRLYWHVQGSFCLEHDVGHRHLYCPDGVIPNSQLEAEERSGHGGRVHLWRCVSGLSSQVDNLPTNPDSVVATSVWRLHGIVETQGATHPYIDFTWWSPTLIVLSCLEVDLAIICASMPIFWPIIEKSLSAIFVSYEVQVVEERVDDYGLAYELEHMKDRGRSGSIKSSGTSTQELTNEDEEVAHSKKPSFTVGFDPLSEEAKGTGLSTNVETKIQPKWQL
jgi:hypothetical protein